MLTQKAFLTIVVSVLLVSIVSEDADMARSFVALFDAVVARFFVVVRPFEDWTIFFVSLFLNATIRSGTLLQRGRCRYSPFLRGILQRGGGTFLRRGTAIRRLDNLLCGTFLQRSTFLRCHRPRPIRPIQIMMI